MRGIRDINLLNRFSYLTAMLLASWIIGYGLESIHFKLGWMFGGVAGAAMTSYLLLPSFNITGKLYISKMRHAGQAILGSGIGSLLQFSQIAAVGWLFADIVIMMFMSLISSLALAIVFSFFSRRQSVKTTFFSTLPGGIGIMANLAKEYGANAELVAIMQSARILAVVVFTPLALTKLMPHNIDATPLVIVSQAQYQNLVNAVIMLAISGVGYVLANRMRIASPSLIGPLVLAILIGNLMPSHRLLAMPLSLSHLAQILLGVTLGHGIIARLVTLHWWDLFLGLLSMVSLLLFSLAIAAVFHAIAPIDWQTAILSTAPGGAAEMIILAKTLNSDMEIVVTAQVFRQIVVNALVPLWVIISHHVDLRLKRKQLSG